MPQDFLLHLHISVARTQQTRVRVPERAPADDLEHASTLSRVTLEAVYAGDAQHWPAYARVGS
jgi:hypothetical protein